MTSMRIWLLLQPLLILFTAAKASAAATLNTISPSCQAKCGNVSIPYPFGIGNNCFLYGFEILCNKMDSNDSYKPYIGNIEVINISILSAQARIYKHIAFACYDFSGNMLTDHSNNSPINLTATPYRFSDTRNKFTAIGCRTLVYIKDPFAVGQVYMSGCLSICNSNCSVPEGGPCSGMGCCQTSIPKGLTYYEALFDPGFNHSFVWNFSPCSYAFLADQDWYKFNSSDVSKYNVYYRNNKHVPVVLDWAIGNETCEQAKRNKTAYACVSQYSECINSTNGPGYICNCSTGYQGNPYLPNGCQDINECKDPEQYQCYGKCINSQGSFSCSCPSGKHGDPFRQGGCQPKLSLLLKLFIAGLCIFLVTAVMYLVYEKAKLFRAKQKCFRQNGGLFLQEQINAHQCVRFKIFTIDEMKRATNNFDRLRVLGQGGQGTVYEGILDDKRRVAVKKSIKIDEKKKKDFAKEMYVLSLINHKNVIKILGCCLEVEVPILVYEFLSKGTLFQTIHNKNQRIPLDFRLKTAVDSAAALAYLHSDAFPPILHGDVKSANILLDDEYMAKISDFGASLLTLEDISELDMVQGTTGYLDPECLQTWRLTEKSDVYSFGVVLLELLTRKKALYSEGSGEMKSLAQSFKQKGLPDILDEEIKNEVSAQQIQEFAELLRGCLSEKGEERPSMTKVVAWLRRLTDFNQNLSEKHNLEDIERDHGESSSYHTTETTPYCSSEHQAVFELEYLRTR